MAVSERLRPRREDSTQKESRSIPTTTTTWRFLPEIEDWNGLRDGAEVDLGEDEPGRGVSHVELGRERGGVRVYWCPWGAGRDFVGLMRFDIDRVDDGGDVFGADEHPVEHTAVLGVDGADIDAAEGSVGVSWRAELLGEVLASNALGFERERFDGVVDDGCPLGDFLDADPDFGAVVAGLVA